MSVIINNESFPIYRSDTIDSIVQRYTFTKGLDPFYYHLQTEVNYSTTDTVKSINDIPIKFIKEKDYNINKLENSIFILSSITDILNEVDFDDSTDESVKESIDQIKQKSLDKKIKLDDPKDSTFGTPDDIVIFLHFIKLASEGDEENRIKSEEEYKELIDIIYEDIELFGLGNYLKRVEDSFFQFIKKKYYTLTYSNTENENIEKLSTLKLTDINIDVLKTPIKETQNNYKGNFTSTVDIYEIFNTFVPTRYIPFLKINKFYKILNDYTFPIEWIQVNDEEGGKDEESLRLYILKEKEESEYNIQSPSNENYVMIKIDTISNDSSTFKYSYKIINDIGSVVFNEELILTRFTNIFKEYGLNIENVSIQKNFGKGFLVYKGIDINREMFFDMALNNEIVSKLVAINEIFRIEKVKGGIRFTISTNSTKQTKISCSMYFKTVDKASSKEVQAYEGLINVGDNIILLNIVNATSETDMNNLLDLFDSILVYTYKSKESFYNYYSQYISNIEELTTRKIPVTIEKKDLKDIFPEIFVSGYSRKCDHKPIVTLSNDESEQFKNEGLDVLQFPKTSAEGRQGYYVCKDMTYKHVGLIRNELSNKDKIGLLPCCYKEKQINKGLRYEYEEGNIDIKGNYIGVEEEKKQPDTIITTQKILGINRYGLLPPNVLSLLNVFEEDILLNKNRFLRMGVDISQYSCIHAILMALDKQDTFYSNITKFKNKLLQLSQYNFTSQNMLFPKDIKYIVKNDEYIDPSLFISILENMFEVNIIIFCKDANDNNGFCTPTFKKFIINNKKQTMFENTVLLFKTFGSESTRLKYPQVELIVEELELESDKKVKGKLKKIFESDSYLIKELYKLYYSSINVINVNCEFNSKLISQVEDSYGKIRYLHFEDDVHVYISPAASFDIDSFSNNVVYNQSINLKETNIEKFNKFVENEKLKGIKGVFSSHYNKIIGYYFTKNNVKCFVYTDKQSELYKERYDLEYNEYITPIGKESSLIKKYNSFLKLSNIIISYTLYLFSKKYNNELKQFLQLKYNEEFVKSIKDLLSNFSEFIIVIPSHTYSNINRVISLKNTSFIKDSSKLIVTSNNIKLRVLYSIHMFLKTDYNFVLEYKDKKYIPNFFTTSKDFEQSEHYSIYFTKKEIAIYRLQPSLTYTCFSNPPNKTDITFFYSNIEVEEGTIFLAKKASSLENAIYVSNYWKKYKQLTSDLNSIASTNNINLTIYYKEDEMKVEEYISNEDFPYVYVLAVKFSENESVTYYTLLNYRY